MPTDSLTVYEADVDELDGRWSNAIGDIVDRKYIALIVRRVFPPELMASVVRRITAGEVSLPSQDGPLFRRIYGRPIATATADLRGYLEAVEPFLSGCRALFGSSPAVETRIQDTLTRVAGGRPVSVPRTPDGRSYIPATLRVLGPGGALPPHYENGTWERPSSEQVKTLVDPTCLMSFYCPVQLPEAGGLLNVFAADCLDGGDRFIEDRGPEKALDALHAGGARTLLPGVGDMLLFDGGRHYHQVSEVRGARTRWTLGGFLALSRAHDRVYFWS